MAKVSQTDEASRLVDDLVSKHAVVIFGRPTCPACNYTKSIMDSACHGLLSDDQIKVVNKDSLGPLQPYVTTYLNKITGQNYIPNVFIGGKTVGYKDTVAAYKAGKLRQMLVEAKGAMTSTRVYSASA